MRLTVLGGAGAWPSADQACSGYLLEHDGYHLLLDPGYATFPVLQRSLPAERLDAVLVSHGHPDHCADLNPLLRARMLRDDPAGPLPVYAPAGALAAVLALDRPGMLDAGYQLHQLAGGGQLQIGPFRAHTRLLPHMLPNLGVRLAAGGRVLAYTGDCGPSPELVELARDADLLVAEATYPEQVPADLAGSLSSARDAGRQARDAGAGRLLLTHLQPGTDPAAARAAAAAAGYGGEVGVASSGLVVALS